MFYSPVMPPSLIKKYPEIRTYTGIGLENPSEWVSVTVGKDKIKAMILGSDGTVFIDPVKDGMDLYRISKTEMGAPVSRNCAQCENDDAIEREGGASSRTTRNFPSCVGEDEPCYSIGDTLVTFRFAGILTAEANNEAELISILALMIESLQQPFLIEGDFIPEVGNGELEFSFIRDDDTKYH
jgi:hypothetical protein